MAFLGHKILQEINKAFHYKDQSKFKKIDYLIKVNSLGTTEERQKFSNELSKYLLDPKIKEYAIFTHFSNELGHAELLKYLNEDPLLFLEMSLGEGTGVALAYPLLKSAVLFLNEMESFESAGVKKISDFG